jgi:hypothetical protein
LPKHFPTKYAPIRPITTAEVQTAQNVNLSAARGVAAKNNRNGMYGPGIIAHSKAIISQNRIQSQLPEIEYIFSGLNKSETAGIFNSIMGNTILLKNTDTEIHSL